LNAIVLFSRFFLNLTPCMTKLRVLVLCFSLCGWLYWISHLISNVGKGDYKEFCNLKLFPEDAINVVHWQTLEDPTERNVLSYTLVEIHITTSHWSCISFCLHHSTSIDVEIIQYEPGFISIE
jgi:hypothetical protein